MADGRVDPPPLFESVDISNENNDLFVSAREVSEQQRIRFLVCSFSHILRLQIVAILNLLSLLTKRLPCDCF